MSNDTTPVTTAVAPVRASGRPVRRWPGALALVVCCLAGALLNLTRAAYWTPWTGFTWNPRAVDAYVFDEGPVVVGGFKKLLVPAPGWRPLRLVLTVRSPAARVLTVESPADGLSETREPRAGEPLVLALDLTAASERDGLVSLYCSARGPDLPGSGVIVDAVRVAPVFGWWPLAHHGVTGALAGAALWVMTIGWTRVARPRALPATPGPERGAPLVRAWTIASLLVAALLLPWAYIKPPLQAPDEPQHIARATSVLLGPWVAGVQHFAVDNRHLITLSWGASPVLAGLIGRPDRYLTRPEIDGLRRQAREPTGDRLRVPSAVASYPPLFYCYVFAAAEIARLVQLTPWQTLYFLRLAVVAVGSVLWGGVFVALRRDALLRDRAGIAVALMAGTPMYSFLGSSVTPDAVVIPLALWLAVLCWRGVRSTPPSSAIAVVALLLLFTKPSGIQIVSALVVAVACHAWRHRASAACALAVVRTLLAVALCAFVAYYAWSPPSLSDGAGLSIAWPQYLRELVARIPDLWVMAWGKLGWVEYQAPAGFYVLLLVAVVGCVGWLWWSRPELEGAALFFGAYLAMLVTTTVAGEFVSVSRTGYMLQGRYFLPGLVCIAPLIARAPALPRLGLAISVGALHLALFWLTFVRYWHADLGAFAASLPF